MKVSFKVLKASLADGVQDSDLGLSLKKVGERTGNGAIDLDEPSIEIGETQEALEFLDRRGYGPISDGGYLPLVHFDAILVDVVTQEFD